MKNTILAGIAAFTFAGTASAQQLTGSIGVEVFENDLDKVVAETTIGFGADVPTGVGMAFGGFEFESVDGDALVLDSWQVGIDLGRTVVSFGDQGDLFPGNDLEIVGGSTLANPETYDSLMASYRFGDFGELAGMIAFTDIHTDMEEISNVQLAYTANYGSFDLGAAVDYNKFTEDYTLGAKAGYAVTDEFGVNGIVTWNENADVVGYEAGATYMMFAGYFNGDNTDGFQNVGIAYNQDFDNLNVYAEFEHNVDTNDNTFGVGVGLQF